MLNQLQFLLAMGKRYLSRKNEKLMMLVYDEHQTARKCVIHL